MRLYAKPERRKAPGPYDHLTPEQRSHALAGRAIPKPRARIVVLDDPSPVMPGAVGLSREAQDLFEAVQRLDRQVDALDTEPRRSVYRLEAFPMHSRERELLVAELEHFDLVERVGTGGLRVAPSMVGCVLSSPRLWHRWAV